ncbi:MAG: right-handed parallel beta-helix repeat-containing protein [Sedimentisphaerales bacterium]
MAKVRLFSILLAILFIFSNLSSGGISFVGEGYIPEPNEEITLQIQTDTPLFAMGAAIYVVGDANITGGMCEADCNNFGWDNGWSSDPYIDDANGFIYLSGVRWASDANGIIGYIKFRYNSGQVSVYVDQENSVAFSWDANGCQYVPFSTDTFLFGEPDPNDSSQSENSLEENISAAEVNDVNLPFGSLLRQAQQEPRGHLMRCPVDSNSLNNSETVSKSFWKTLDNRNFQNNIMSELAAEDGGGQSLMDSEPSIIEINSDITTNQIWTANNVYYVTTPINVQALLVIEPGTIIMFSDADEYYDCALYVNNGGTLISKGTPDKPIVYTCDFLYFKEPKEIGCYWQYVEASGKYSFCPIFIERTASTATTVTYNFIEGGNYGILTDNISLDHPIENNYLSGNFYGIFEGGTRHTDIINNLCFYNFGIGIEVYLPDENGIGDANSHILIQNNTCDRFQNQGIYIHGVMDANQAGTVMLINNIVTESYWHGLYLCDPGEYVVAFVSNTGYGSNRMNKNWEFEEYNPVEVNDSPYNYGNTPYEWFYLEPNCAFIDAGLEYIEQSPLIGTTTDINSLPDCNKIDIGFHYPNWDYSNANTGFAISDFNKDTITDYEDLYTLTANWLDTVEPNSNGDLNGDETVNFKDFALFANSWKKIHGYPSIAAFILSDTNDINNVNGSFDVDVNSSDFANGCDFIFMDGQLIAPMPELGGQITIDSYKFRNGIHDLKVVHSGWSGITVSAEQPITFNNPIYCTDINDLFDIHNSYRINGLHDGNSALDVQITDINESVIWSDKYSGSDVNIVIPQSIFSSQMFCSLSITETEAMEMNAAIGDESMTAMDSGSSGVSIDLTREFNPADYTDLKAVIIMPDKDVYKPKKPAILACAQAFQNRLGNTWAALYIHDVTPENLTNIYSRPSLKYIYWCGHGNSMVGDVQRTNTQCWKLTDEGYIWDSYERIGVFPWTQQTVGSPVLPNNWDYRGFDLWGIQLSSGAYMHYSANKKIIFVDGCLSGLYSDMAETYGVFYGTSSMDQIYIGWDREIMISSDPVGEFFLGASIEGIRMFWERMGLDSSPYNNVYAAFNYVSSYGSSQSRKSLFGLNALWDGGAGDDHIRTYGWGGQNMSNIRLQP